MRLRARGYAFARRVVGRIHKPLQPKLGRWALPFLSPDDVMAITVDTYRAGCGFEDREFNFQGFHPWEDEAVQKSFGDAKSVLVAGAGAGREMIALARKGFAVAGFDPSRALVDAGRRHLKEAGIGAILDHSDPGSAPAFEQIFDALLIGAGAYHHIASRARRVAFLRDCAKSLRPGGALVLISASRDDSGRARGPTDVFPEPGDTLVDAYGHAFLEEEVIDEIEAAGFSDVACYAPSGRPAFMASARKST